MKCLLCYPIAHTILTVIVAIISLALLLLVILCVIEFCFKRKKDVGSDEYVIVILGCVLMLLVSLYSTIPAVYQEIQYYKFNPYFNEYISIGLKSNTHTYGNEYLPGKVVVINKEDNNFDDLYFNLPGELKAENPEEVDAIIWTSCQSSLTGTYTDGSEAYRIVCGLTIINKKDSSILHEKEFYGNAPSYMKTTGGSRSGDRPDTEMKSYLETLKIGEVNNASYKNVGQQEEKTNTYKLDNITLFYPKDWTVEDRYGLATFSPLSETTTNMSLYVPKMILTSVISSSLDLEPIIKDYKKNITNFELMENNEITIGNNTARKLVFTGNYEQHNMKLMQIYILKNGIVYLFMYSAEVNKYQNYIGTIEKMLNSVKIYDNTKF